MHLESTKYGSPESNKEEEEVDLEVAFEMLEDGGDERGEAEELEGRVRDQLQLLAQVRCHLISSGRVFVINTRAQ